MGHWSSRQADAVKGMLAPPNSTMLLWGRDNSLQPPPYPIEGILVPVRRNHGGFSSWDTTTEKHIGDYVNGHARRKPQYNDPDLFIVFIPVGAFFMEDCHRWNEHTLYHVNEGLQMHDINERPILDLNASQLVAGNLATRAAAAAAKQEFERASKDRMVAKQLGSLERAIEHPLEHVRDATAQFLSRTSCLDRLMLRAMREAVVSAAALQHELTRDEKAAIIRPMYEAHWRECGFRPRPQSICIQAYSDRYHSGLFDLSYAELKAIGNWGRAVQSRDAAAAAAAKAAVAAAVAAAAGAAATTTEHVHVCSV